MDIIRQFLESLRKFLTPPSAYSWQTLISLSFFSWLMSFLATELVQNFISCMGWIFLIFGVSWATTENPIKIWGIPIGPWITGALVCIFIFGVWTGEVPPAAWVSWPIISAILASLRDFITDELRFKVPPPVSRQKLVILFGCNLLVSCWIQFHFLIQDWLRQYPSLLADDLRGSTFITQLSPQSAQRTTGASVLDSMGTQLQAQLENQPWSNVERWLLEIEKNLNVLKEKATTKLPRLEEDIWWSYTYQILSQGSGYDLQLQAVWQGPRSQPQEYALRKSCQITQVYQQTNSSSDTTSEPIAVGRVSCQPVNPS